ncbi:MAG: MAPEG family protein [Actinomycetota bacterium]|nr:MAPEG family protein [Acidimicrobiales bacterium]MEC8976323.1 MAPEG family protein [Actinomycetota bacterium]MED6305036.1 MAPEG family protein [Actinomycetota bacterium]
MDTELTYLAWSAFLCIVLWLPYVLERIQSQGLVTTLNYPANPPAPAAWAQRAQRAHLNLVENLPAFAALVIIANITDANAATGAALFFWARLAHAVVHILGIPYVRTLAFAVSWIGMLVIFFSVL